MSLAPNARHISLQETSMIGVHAGLSERVICEIIGFTVTI